MRSLKRSIAKAKKEKQIAQLEGQVDKLPEIDTRVELIQMLIPLGLMHVNELLQAEVEALAGQRYARGGGVESYVRWGSQRGSVYLADQKLPVEIPRVRDHHRKVEVSLQSYEQLQRPRQQDEGVLKRILAGLSCRNYEACAEAVPEAFGLSPSTISRHYIRASRRKLKALMERGLDGYDFVALFLDGKTFAEDSLVLAVGVTTKGEKVILGLVQTATENAKACSQFLAELGERGLRYEEGLLVVIDGSKGLRKAIETVFGPLAVVQRCQWHKRENVVSYLPKRQQVAFRKKLQRAYEQPTYEGAKRELAQVRKELKLVNESAVKSLDEGLEETLTLHRLGLFEELGMSFKTTNCLESIMAQVGLRTDKVDYWKNSHQKQRWVATALLDIEPRLRKIKGYRHLVQLRKALVEEIAERRKAA
jgi:transposase-like protein